MVSRDPEFDDGDLERLLALAHYEAGVCSCGFHESLTADRSNVFQFEYRTCDVCKGVDQYRRVEAEEAKRMHDQFEKQPASTSRPDDGRRLYIRQLNALEVAARRAQRR